MDRGKSKLSTVTCIAMDLEQGAAGAVQYSVAPRTDWPYPIVLIDGIWQYAPQPHLKTFQTMTDFTLALQIAFQATWPPEEAEFLFGMCSWHAFPHWCMPLNHHLRHPVLSNPSKSMHALTTWYAIGRGTSRSILPLNHRIHHPVLSNPSKSMGSIKRCFLLVDLTSADKSS
jgi:hypothetical protein